MKVIRGGGGIDKDGNPYTLPNETVDVPDDAFDKMAREIMKSARDEFMPVSQEAFDLMQKIVAEKGPR